MSKPKAVTAEFHEYGGLSGVTTRDEVVFAFVQTLDNLEKIVVMAGYVPAWDTVTMATEQDYEDITTIGGEHSRMNTYHTLRVGIRGVKIVNQE